MILHYETSKYKAIEEAMYKLSQSGYNIEDPAYQALVKERASLENLSSKSNRYLKQAVKAIVKEISEFRANHGLKATQDALHNGAFHDHTYCSSFGINTIIHPTVEISELVPDWIQKAYAQLVD